MLDFEKNKKYIIFGGGFGNLRKNFPLLNEALVLLTGTHVVAKQRKVKFDLPSKSEGSPQALKEAVACNCPILATDIADVKHLLGDLEGHYICTFDADNVEYQIKNAIAFNGRTKGRERIIESGLTNNQVADKIVNIYKTILQ